MFQPQMRKVSANEHDMLIGSLRPATTYFIIVTAFDSNGHTIARSQQVEAQTTAPITTPVITLGYGLLNM